MKNMYNLRLLALSIILCASSNNFTAENPLPQVSNQQSLSDLPTDVLQEISSFLPNLKAANIKEYFTALDNFRLTSKTAKKAVDAYITNFLKNNAVTIDPKISAYNTFKNYLALSFLLKNKEFQLDEEKANKEENELEKNLQSYKQSTAYDPNTPDSYIKIGWAINSSKNNQDSDWLIKNKDIIKSFYKTLPLTAQKSLVGQALNFAIAKNNLKLSNALLYFANPNEGWKIGLTQLVLPKGDVKPLEVARAKEAQLKQLLEIKSNDPELLQAQMINHAIIKLLIFKGAQ